MNDLTSLVQGTQNPPEAHAAQLQRHRRHTVTMRSRPVRRALMVVLALNALSAAQKVSVGARTGALTALAAALESVLDMLSNGVGSSRCLSQRADRTMITDGARHRIAAVVAPRLHIRGCGARRHRRAAHRVEWQSDSSPFHSHSRRCARGRGGSSRRDRAYDSRREGSVRRLARVARRPGICSPRSRSSRTGRRG